MELEGIPIVVESKKTTSSNNRQERAEVDSSPLKNEGTKHSQPSLPHNTNNHRGAAAAAAARKNTKKSSSPLADNHQKRSHDEGGGGDEIIKSSLRGYFDKAQQLLHVRRFHEALIVLAKGASLHPSDSAQVLLSVLRSDAYAGLMDFGSAIACLRSALLATTIESELQSLRSRLAYLLDTAAIAALQKNQPEKAHELVDEAVELDGGGTLEILLHRCFCLIALQRLDDASNELAGLRFVAETMLNESVALECVVLSVSLGIVQRRFEDAKHFLEMTLKKTDPAEDTSSIGGFGDSGAGGGSSGAGVGAGGKASWADHPRIIELEREFDHAFANFIREAKASGDVHALSAGIRCFPSDPELYRARAEALVEKGLFAQGIQDYFKTIEKSSGKDDSAEKAVSKTLFSVAKQLVLSVLADKNSSNTNINQHVVENLQAAVTYLSESHKWNPSDVEVIVMRGDCLFQLKEHEAALGDFQRGQTLDPENSQIRQRISDLHNIWGTRLFEEKSYEAAEEAFTKAIEVSPFEPRYFYLRAQCRLLSAKCPEDHLLGVRDLIECRKLGTTDPEILLMVSQLCPDDRVTESHEEFMERQSEDEYLLKQHRRRNRVSELYNSSVTGSLRLQHDRQKKTFLHRGSVGGTDDADEVTALRGNRAELLSSPIDSKKLREATASITDPKSFSASRLLALAQNRNSGQRGSCSNGAEFDQHRQKEPIWLKKGVVTTLQVKNRLERHDFIGASSSHQKNSNSSTRNQVSSDNKNKVKAVSPPPTMLLPQQVHEQEVMKRREMKTQKQHDQKHVQLPPIFGVNVL